MNHFTYFQPTEIHFGCGRVSQVGELVARYGKRCLVVTGPMQRYRMPLMERVDRYLKDAGVEVTHFDQVVPNPTIVQVSRGASIAKEFNADIVLGLGGGSSMDTAKAIAVQATHAGPCWDYLYFCEKQPTEKTLPVIAVPTTSGTGSQVTQVAVVTNPETKTKSAIYNAWIYPKAAIVDPELTVTVSPHITASTGFDVFCHAFESYLHVSASAYTDLMALHAIRLVAQYLPAAVMDGSNLQAREAIAWADTLAGLCIANAGVTLPHGIGMTIGGQCPQVMHGEALAVVYPEFTRFTYSCAAAKFATMGRILNAGLEKEDDRTAALHSCEQVDTFLKRIGMWLGLKDLGVSEQDLITIADNSRILPDFKNNPRIATRDEIFQMLINSYVREQVARHL